MTNRREWGRVALAMRVGADAVPVQTMASLIALLMQGIREGDLWLPIQYRNYHHQAANEIVRRFLAETSCDSLLFIDADQTFDARALERLRSNRHGKAFDIVGGLYVNRDNGTPHAYRFSHVASDNSLMHERVTEWEPGHVIPVDALGLGFTMIRRSALERMAPPYFYHRTATTGEDISFCYDARQAGLTIGLDTSLKIGHLAIVSLNHGDMVE